MSRAKVLLKNLNVNHLRYKTVCVPLLWLVSNSDVLIGDGFVWRGSVIWRRSAAFMRFISAHRKEFVEISSAISPPSCQQPEMDHKTKQRQWKRENIWAIQGMWINGNSIEGFHGFELRLVEGCENINKHYQISYTNNTLVLKVILIIAILLP